MHSDFEKNLIVTRQICEARCLVKMAGGAHKIRLYFITHEINVNILEKIFNCSVSYLRGAISRQNGRRRSQYSFCYTFEFYANKLVLLKFACKIFIQDNSFIDTTFTSGSFLTSCQVKPLTAFRITKFIRGLTVIKSSAKQNFRSFQAW